MKWLVLNEHLLDFMALLSNDSLDFFEKALDNFEIVKSPFSIEINDYVSIQCVVDQDIAIISSFNYGKYSYLNFGETQTEIEFIQALEARYFESNSYIELSAKNKRKYLN